MLEIIASVIGVALFRLLWHWGSLLRVRSQLEDFKRKQQQDQREREELEWKRNIRSFTEDVDELNEEETRDEDASGAVTSN